MKKWVIINQHEISDKLKGSNKPVPLNNGQYYLRVNDENEHLLRGYIKFSESEIKALDKSTVIKFKNIINRFEKMETFSSKKTNEGFRLFKRIHGVKKNCVAGDNILDISVPYTRCNIEGLEVLWADEGTTASLKVYDTPEGTISGTSNGLLNQFGFTVNIAKDFYSRLSQYEADLLKDMKLELVINIPQSKTIGVNFILNELKQ